MADEWNPFKEKTEQVDKVLSTVERNIKYVVAIVITLIICYTANTMYKSYLYRTQQGMPCEEVLKLIRK